MIAFTLVAAHAAFDQLAARMADLQAAERHGNVDRIGNAAHDADMAAIDLSAKLGAVFGAAAQASDAAYEARRSAPALLAAE